MKREAKCQGVCNCPDCTRAPSLKTRVKHANDALYTLGKTYWKDIPWDKVDTILAINGFKCGELETLSTQGTQTHRAPIGEDKWLLISWYHMETSDTYEVNAYVS